MARQPLMNLGMTAEQIEEVARTRQPAYLVQIRAPADGLVISRNVSLGQSFDARDDLFTIADLDQVWVLADAFEGQEEFFKPGTRAIVTQPGAGRRFAAVVSAVPPRFEAATRTLKVRLDVANPGLLLRPDMLVDVELPVEVGPAIFVPKEAVLDSGTRRLIFVEQGEGVFVPARGAHGPPARREGRDHRRPHGGRDGRHLRELPPRLGEPDARRGGRRRRHGARPDLRHGGGGGEGPRAGTRERARRDELVLLHARPASTRSTAIPKAAAARAHGRDRAHGGGEPRRG